MGVSCTQKKIAVVVVPSVILPKKEEKKNPIEHKASEHYHPILEKLLAMQNCIKPKHIIKQII